MFDSLKKLWRSQPEIGDLFASLHAPSPFRFSLDRIPKGIDNTHLDIYLSPQFTSATRILVRRMLLHDIGVNSWGEQQPPPSVKDLENFEKSYTSLMESGVGKARKESAPDQIHLLHFAILKYLLLSVGEEILQHRDRLEHARTMDGDQSSGNAVHLHDKLVSLAKEETSLRYRITRKLFRHVYKLESTTLRKLRKSVLGRSWPVPKILLFNPVLQLPSLWAEEQFMHHYPLAMMSREEPERFSQINAIITDIFSYGLPAWAHAPGIQLSGEDAEYGRESASMRLRHDRGMLSGFLETELLLSGSIQSDEYVEGLFSWLDDPGNMEAILFLDTSESQAKAIRRLRDENAVDSSSWMHLQKQIVDEARRRFRSEGLNTKIFASQEVPKVYKELNGRVPLALISQFLEGRLSSRKLMQRLSGLKMVTQPHIAKKVLEIAKERIRRLPSSRKDHLIKCFLRDFSQFRRDLKLAYQSHCLMNNIRILMRDETIELSRRNHSLQEFVHTAEDGADKQHQIRNHVIIKADLRGSTAITAELLEKKLNPASHFSLNFFQPITKLLDIFGATKVFVEGDAVILSIAEYEDAPYQWLCVSHACGLARKILHVVDQQNAQNRKHGLPELELGLGISFNDGSPTFLYDGDREIMISPAINRADRLSSCASALRSTGLAEKVKRGVEVVVPVDQGMSQKSRNDELLSYNVNGIELDMPAFFKLKNELALLRVGGTISGYSEHSVFYAGRYPDRSGNMHWLVVREAPVRLWVGNSVNTEEEWGRRFYEVITNPTVINHLKERILDKKDSPEEVSGLQDLPEDDPDGTRYFH